ncbi:MAG: gluconate 2-dehydrogenase subunit 3 family protein [Myxococcota bacterium]
MKMYLPPPGARPTRRSFLQKGLIGGALLALGGGTWLALRRSAPVVVPEGLQVLSPREYAVMWALVQRFAPPRDGFPSADSIKTTLAVDGIFAMLEDVTRTELKQLLMLFENALPNFLFGGRTTPFTQLDPTEQDAVLAEWRDSRLPLRRTGYVALRGLVMAAYYGNRATWAPVGYPGPPPNIHDPNAPLWKGGEQPRPVGNGTFLEPTDTPAPETTP